MKKLAIIGVLFLCSCGPLNSFLGINDKGDTVNKNAPVTYLTSILNALGPLGATAAAGLTVAGSMYVGNRKGKNALTGVVAGIQKAKSEMSIKDKEALVEKLKKNIPNKYHKIIGKIKDTL